MMRRSLILGMALALGLYPLLPPASAYVLNRTVGNSGGCPQYDRHNLGATIDRRWIVSFPTNKYFTQSGAIGATPTAGQILEISQAIESSFDVWASAGTSLVRSSLQPLVQVSTTTTNDCNFTDNRNTICFNEPDAFATGVIAFTIVSVNFSNPVGEILDADVLFNPDPNISLATRQAQSSSHYDLESVMTHELGHFFGFSHSSVMRAMMYPFAPAPGTFHGGAAPADRCPIVTSSGPLCDTPLSDDDRAGLRVLYPNAADTLNIGSIAGRILPANPISNASAAQPTPGPLTGIFGAHVVAEDADSGAVMASIVAGWSCNPSTGQIQFDGSYKIEGLPVNRNYKLLVEPLDQPTTAPNISNALNDLCRPGSCNVPRDAQNNPVVNTNFTTKVKPQ